MVPSLSDALIGAVFSLVGAVVGALAAWFAASSTNKIQKQIADDNNEFQKRLAKETELAQRWSAIESQILKLTEFAIQYPTLEKDSFCDAYPNVPGDQNGKARYENYCVYVFNALAAVYGFCDGDLAKIRTRIVDKELIRRHHRCWLEDYDNLDHDPAFRQYVQSVIDDLKREGKIK